MPTLLFFQLAHGESLMLILFTLELLDANGTLAFPVTYPYIAIHNTYYTQCPLSLKDHVGVSQPA